MRVGRFMRMGLWIFLPLITIILGQHVYKKIGVSSMSQIQSSITKPKLFASSKTGCQMQCSMEFNNNSGCTAVEETEDMNCTFYLSTGDSLKVENNSTIKIWKRKELDQGEAVFVVGGLESVILNKAEIFSLNGKCPKIPPPLPKILHNLLIKLLQNSLWVCGGEGYYRAYNKDCWAYNFVTGNWVWKTTSNFYHEGPIGEVYQNKLYLPHPSNPEYYDPVKDVWGIWKPIPQNMPDNGRTSASAIWQDIMIVSGGPNNPTMFFIFNFTSNTWNRKDTGIKMLSPVLHILPNDVNLMLAVGFDNATIYNLVSGTWTKISLPNQIRCAPSLASMQGRTFIFNGAWGTEWWGIPLNTVEEFHLFNNSWTMTGFNTSYISAYQAALKIPAFLFNCNGKN